MPADKNEEVFEVVDSHNEVIGTQIRGVCHKDGLPHRAVYCFVFNTSGQVLLQRRSERKTIGKGQWDLSVAEHLQPGETYSEAVVRGLHEELGIQTDVSQIEGPLSPCHRRTLLIPGVVHDVEFVASYRLDNFEGKLQLDEDEVQDTKWQHLPDLYKEVNAEPERFTSWLRAEVGMLRDILEGSSVNKDQIPCAPEVPSVQHAFA